MKLTIIGGGSIFTPLLVDGLPGHASDLPISEVALLDPDQPAAERVAGFTRRSLARRTAQPPKIQPTADHQTAIEGSDFVVFCLRVGGLAARIQDEKIPLRFGIAGDETIGPGGFAGALRTIPVVLDYAREIERWAPSAWVIPFANPEGLLTEALTRHSSVRAVGLCTAPYGLRLGAARLLGVEARRVQVDLIGVTHTGWVRGVTLDGREVLPELAGRILDQEKPAALYPPAILRALSAYPAHWFYSLMGFEVPHFYYHARAVYEQQTSAGRTRGEQLLARQQEIQARLDDAGFTTEELAKLRGHPVVDEPILALMSALHNDSGEMHIVDAPQRGAVAGFEPDAVLELPARIDRRGAHPLPSKPLPPEVRGLMQMIKAYEELTVEAAVRRSTSAALRALLTHPLVQSYTVAGPLLDELLRANRRFLPEGWPAGQGG